MIPEIVSANSLPEWLSPEISKNLSVVALVILGILLLFVLRFISKVILKLFQELLIFQFLLLFNSSISFINLSLYLKLPSLLPVAVLPIYFDFYLF